MSGFFIVYPMPAKRQFTEEQQVKRAFSVMFVDPDFDREDDIAVPRKITFPKDIFETIEQLAFTK